MELREWLIILGLALVTIIVIDGVRRLQRQRRVPRLDQVSSETSGLDEGNKGKEVDPEEAAREAELNWELPNGGARVVKPASYSNVETRPKPKLERQEHPGPSRVLSEWRNHGATSDKPAQKEVRHETRAAPTAASSTSVGERSTARSAPNEAVEPTSERVAARQQAKADEPQRSQSEPAAETARRVASEPSATAQVRSEPTLSALDDDQPSRAYDEKRSYHDEPELAGLSADPEDHDEHDAERYRLVDLDGMTDSLKSGSVRMGASMQRFGASLQKTLAERKEQRKKEKLKRDQEKAERKALEASRRQQERAEREAREAEKLQREKDRSLAEDDYDDPLFAPPRRSAAEPRYDEMTFDAADAAPRYEASEAHEESVAPQEGVVTPHPVVEKALRHDVNGEHARDTLSHAEEVIVISVMSRDEEGFSGAALLDLMLACGLRYSSEMGVFHRFETEDPLSELQFSMVNVVKPGTFPLTSMDDFRTPGITLLMPLPGAHDTAAAFEAMVETAMVVVRHLGGELKDENRSVMTAQTVEFARQRVQEFERRHRLHRYQAN